METKVETLEGNRVKVEVTIDAKQVDAQMKEAYRNAARKYNFPGFRKGKAPRPVIDNALGKEYIPATVTDDLVNKTYPVAIDEAGIYPVGNPSFDDDTPLVASGSAYVFSFEVETKPQFELESYEPVEVELPAETVSDKEVQEQIDRLREHYFELVDATAATKVKPENWLELAIKASDDAGEDIASISSESRLWGMDSTLLPQAFNDELLGMKKGQTKTFDIPMPSDTTVMTAPLVGKTENIHFEVEVKVVKKKVLPEVTDEWVKEKLGFKDVQDMHERIAESIKAQKDDFIPRLKEMSCLSQLAERLQGEPPQAMCEQEETKLLQTFFENLQRRGETFDTYLASEGMDSEQFKEDVKRQALDNVAQDLALDAWARHFDIQASEEDLAQEFINSGVSNPKALEKEWRESGRMHLLREGILRAKASKDLMDTAKVSELKEEEGKEANKEAKSEKKPKKKSTSKASSTSKTSKKSSKATDAADTKEADAKDASEAEAK